MPESMIQHVRRIVKRDLPVFKAFLEVLSIARGLRSHLDLLGLFFFTLKKRVLRQSHFRDPFKLEIGDRNGGAVVTVRDMADITTVAAIFAQDEYASDISRDKVKTILDLGSNIGVSVAYFRMRYPRAHIYAVEADSTNFKRLKENCKDMNNVTLIHGAIGDKTGPIEFHSNESSVSGSLYKREGDMNATVIDGFKIDDLVSRYHIGHIDILKFDIEGAEFDAFKVSPRTLRETNIAMGEVHPDIGNRSADDFIKLFAEYEVKIVPKEKKRFILKASRA